MGKKHLKYRQTSPVIVFLFSFISLFQIQGAAAADQDVDAFLGIKVPTAVSWSPDGSHIAFQVKNFMGNEVHVYCLHEAKARKLISGIPPYGYLEVTTYQNPEPPLCWTPDGQRIIYTNGKDLCSISLQGGEAGPIVKKTGVCLGNVAGRGWALPHFSPDGKKLVYTFTGPAITTHP